MSLYLSTVIWEPELRKGKPQADLIDTIYDLGFEGIEFRPFWTDTVTEVPKISEKLTQKGLSSTYACNDAMLSGTIQSTINGIDSIENSLQIAYDLNADILRFNLAASEFEISFIKEQWWFDKISSLIERATALNIVLAVENAPDFSKGDPLLLKNVLLTFNSSALRLTYDTGNWLYTKYSATQALDMLNEYVGYVHLKDIIYENALPKHTYPGSGVIDLKSLLQRITKVFQGIYTLEFPGGEDPINRIKQSVAFMKSTGLNI